TSFSPSGRCLTKKKFSRCLCGFRIYRETLSRFRAPLQQVNPNTIQRTFQELEREGIAVTRRGTGRFVTSEGEKITELRKEMATELLDNFINGMDNLGFTKEEILPILHSTLEKKRKENE
ncbi:GntR family transcriptional regulator, partial [Bacillus cereus]